MRVFVTIDESGNIVGTSTDERDGWLEVPEGASASPLVSYVVGGEFAAYTAEQSAAKANAPTQGHRWSNTTMSWTDSRSLASIKAAKWDEIKAARDAAEFGVFEWDGSTFDGDPQSLARMHLAATGGMLNPAQVVDWTLADNTVRELDVAALVAALSAYGAHVNATHAAGRAKRAAIEAATTKAEVDAVAW